MVPAGPLQWSTRRADAAAVQRRQCSAVQARYAALVRRAYMYTVTASPPAADSESSLAFAGPAAPPPLALIRRRARAGRLQATIERQWGELEQARVQATAETGQVVADLAQTQARLKGAVAQLYRVQSDAAAAAEKVRARRADIGR
jgi:hypothetical protein